MKEELVELEQKIMGDSDRMIKEHMETGKPLPPLADRSPPLKIRQNNKKPATVKVD